MVVISKCVIEGQASVVRSTDYRAGAAHVAPRLDSRGAPFWDVEVPCCHIGDRVSKPNLIHAQTSLFLPPTRSPFIC